jgi:hypothetical protein
MKKAIAALAVVGASLAIPAFGHAGEETVALPTDPATYVLVTDAPSVSVWSESNDLAGLQTTDTVNEDGSVTPKDTQVL